MRTSDFSNEYAKKWTPAYSYFRKYVAENSDSDIKSDTSNSINYKIAKFLEKTHDLSTIYCFI
jgi:hypothetical protein